MKMRYIVIICTLMFVSYCNSQSKVITENIDLITLREKVIGKKVQLVDVRSAKEYNAGHIDDAMNIDITDKEKFKNEVRKLDKSKPIYIYCYSGGRSNRASKLLEVEGFLEIYDFSGGWKSWSKI